uniref:Cadherin domain-containing protein n=1 Tax=Myripristis murdjan TaxID=586833 RepID=A0A667XWQ1_9TELE
MLDREAKAEFTLVVVAKDQGRPARSATASVLVQVSDVNDNAPMFSQLEYKLEVSELVSVGETLLTLSAVDLDSSNGTLRLAQKLDYSEVKVYRLTVEATDGGTPSFTTRCDVTVTVKDENNNRPQFSEESYDVAVSENLASGASIVTLEVTDRDEVSNTHPAEHLPLLSALI